MRGNVAARNGLSQVNSWRLFHLVRRRPGTGRLEPREDWTMSSDRDELNLTRRQLIKIGGGAAVAGVASQLLSGPALAAGGAPEVHGAKLGFIALTDAAPLIVAKELGLFAKHGMPDVVVAKQASWGATRDNLVLGSGGGGIDGAHILTPMPYLMSLGVNSKQTAMSILARLNVNGQGISVDREYLAA
jgi:nitrate/nitrite transport system substrate-binding protein